jgi:glycosyltransferase involved in cell wall biosynthesis
MDERRFSVCLLVYNHEHVLENTINSIINQSFRNFELIISDDNSTDASFEIILNFAKKDPRIIPLQTTKNLGMAGNANYAISYAKNDYIVLLHHDDMLQEVAFAEWLKCIESNERTAFVFNDYKTKVEKTKKELQISKTFKPQMEGKDFLKNYLLKYWACPVRGTAFIRKKCFDEVGGMDERFGMLADVDLWMRLASKYDVGYVNSPLIEVFENRPENYPKDYTEFSWNRIFLLFDIHSININRNNYPNYLQFIFKRFIFSNKVSFEIIKWQIYALVKSKMNIITSYPGKCAHELYYSKIIYSLIKILFTK